MQRFESDREETGIMNAPKPIRIFIAEDHAIVRKGVRTLLSLDKDLEVVGEAANGREAVEKVRELDPDVILMDLVMPELDGIQAIQQIKAHRPDARVLVLTSFATDEKIFPAIKAGALGYLLKDTDPAELAKAIRQVNAGEFSLHPIIARKVLEELNLSPKHPSLDQPLTGREVEILRRVAQGKSNRQIADELVISLGTVRTHLSNILGKLHLASRTQATLYALREGLASIEDATLDDPQPDD
jgi:NarL family two-component system response regulator LiaR